MSGNRRLYVEKVFADNHGYASTTSLLRAGADSRLLQKMVLDSQIVKIKRGLYKSLSYVPGSAEDMIDLAAAMPNGVFCLFTALAYHDLTTYNPPEFNIAIDRDAYKPVLPEYPPVKVFYFSKERYRTGMITVEIEGYPVKIFDPEKTICDCIRYRNKIGLDMMQEALRAYMSRKNRNIQKLWQYSELLKIKSVIKPYLEALV
jgi:predicted transcriptional regulator of viral defense system